jgi:hypothetical protein
MYVPVHMYVPTVMVPLFEPNHVLLWYCMYGMVIYVYGRSVP